MSPLTAPAFPRTGGFPTATCVPTAAYVAFAPSSVLAALPVPSASAAA